MLEEDAGDVYMWKTPFTLPSHSSSNARYHGGTTTGMMNPWTGDEIIQLTGRRCVWRTPPSQTAESPNSSHLWVDLCRFPEGSVCLHDQRERQRLGCPLL